MSDYHNQALITLLRAQEAIIEALMKILVPEAVKKRPEEICFELANVQGRIERNREILEGK